MSLTAVVVATEPNPMAIARRLAPWGGLSLLHRASALSGWRASYVAVQPVEAASSLLPPEGESTGMAADDTRGAVPRWIGALPYECARALERPAWSPGPEGRADPHLIAPIWRRYGAVVEVHARGTVRVVGDDAAQVRALAHAVREAPLLRTPSAPGRWPARAPLLDDGDPAEAHLARVRAAKALIAAGDLYQVNLARRLRFAVSGDPLDVYAAMAEHTAPPFGVYLDLGEVQVCGSSPELFLSLDPRGRVSTGPIKGTRPRGADARQDRAHARQLAESPKELAELTMIIDVERNDLGRVAEAGTVRVLGQPAVTTHPTLHHRAAVVVAQLKRGAAPVDLLAAMFPSGSVTGAPKVRAMEVIAALEPSRRGLYTGAIGSVAHDGSLELAMAIRVLTIREGEGHYHAGGGIVADSDPEAELAETRWKALQVERLLTPKVG